VNVKTDLRYYENYIFTNVEIWIDEKWFPHYIVAVHVCECCVDGESAIL